MDADGPGEGTREGPGSPTSTGFALGGVGDTTTWACSHLTTRDSVQARPTLKGMKACCATSRLRLVVTESQD